jgi:hypothetical protein
MFTHVVFFKLKDAKKENIEEAKSILLGMEGKIELLKYLEVGVDVLHSQRSYDIALITKFDSLDAMKEYQVHPYHADVVGAHMKAVCESIIAVDYQD